MIMEPPPSPQVVGLEFVRQYYTVLNKAPDHLHRFYSQDSSFVHGGPDTATREERAVYGQVRIHEKIVELDFHDCHAKIRQVDSHATLGEGVVIQVSGELSNKGEPMRRFMQTFVLAPQSPKKYYVHNDIFRYQDEVFCDDDGGDEGVMDEEEDAMLDPAPQAVPVASMNGGGPMIEEPVAVPVAPAPVAPIPPQAVYVNSIENQAAATPMFSEETNVPVHQPMAAQAAPMEPVAVQETFEKDEVSMDNTGSGAEENEEDMKAEDEAMPNSSEEKENKAVVEQGAEPPKNEKRTFATLFRETNAAQSTGNAQPTTATASAPPAPRTAQPASPADSKEPASSGVIPNHGGSGGPVANSVPTTNGGPRDGRFSKPYSNARQPYQQSGPGGRPGGGQVLRERPRSNNDEGGMAPRPFEDRRRPAVTHPDSQQIFVGNVHPSVSEEELKECFSKFGNVVDVRILLPTPGPRNMSDRQCPNYGFVVFDEVDAVQSVLAKAIDEPITYKGHRLNVEEKKAKGSRGYGAGDYGGRSSEYIPRGGPRGGRGGMGGERGRGMGRGTYRGTGGPTRSSPNSSGPGPGGPVPTSSGAGYRR